MFVYCFISVMCFVVFVYVWGGVCVMCLWFVCVLCLMCVRVVCPLCVVIVVCACCFSVFVC